MVSLSATTATREEVTLVTARLEGDPIPRTVRVRNLLDGPVWPPRREGVPVAGWRDDGYEGVVPAEDALVLGYASPAPPVDPPLEVVTVEPASGATPHTDRTTADHAPEEPVTASAAIRELGDPAPPRDAVPTPTVSAAAGDGARRDAG